MKLAPFLLDHWLAAHEFADPPIRYNLASSTGPQWTVGELLDLAGDVAREELDALTLSYAPPQGRLALRERIAALHAVQAEDLVVMTGASEVLVALACHFASDGRAKGGNLVVPQPCYPAVPALARAWGLGVRHYPLDISRGFAQTAAAVLAAVDANTRAVFVNSPHNPTGSVMPVTEQRQLAVALATRGVPLIVDEVYHPLYVSDEVPTASTLGGFAAPSNTLVLGDFAKAMSIPGLRIGWIIDRDPPRRAALIEARSYFTISGSPLTEYLGTLALTHAPAVLAQLRAVAVANLALLVGFMARHEEVLEFSPPAGGTTCFPRLRGARDSRPLCEALAKAGVLVAPGDCFDAPAHLRIGFGAQREGYAEALAIFAEVLGTQDWRA
jgi:aspartate/methionine/tyrosine aminotransferase